MRILLRGRPSVAAVSQYKRKPGDREAVGLFLVGGPLRLLQGGPLRPTSILGQVLWGRRPQ